MDKQTQDFIRCHRQEDVRLLALQAKRFPEVDMGEALVQIRGWQVLNHKVPSWCAIEELRFSPQLSLEQCSSEFTAEYKAVLITRLLPVCKKMVDLTGGLGIDFVSMARHFEESVYVERQSVLCELARHNFPLLGLPEAFIVEGEASDYLKEMSPVDLIYVDPARRDVNGQKVISIKDCEPDVAALASFLKKNSKITLVKLSPMLDIHRALTELDGVAEVHVVAVSNECKELLFVLSDSSSSTRIVCLNNDATFEFLPQEEQDATCVYADCLEAYLYEPNVALLKAGAFRLPAVRFALKKLHPNSHLYTSDKLISEFPGRVFRIEDYGGFGKTELKALRASLTKANLTIRNFPSDIASLRKRLKLSEGGDYYVFATTLANENKVWIRCVKA